MNDLSNDRMLVFSSDRVTVIVRHDGLPLDENVLRAMRNFAGALVVEPKPRISREDAIRAYPYLATMPDEILDKKCEQWAQNGCV